VSLVGVDPCQVFWQVTSAATLNGVNFVGNVVAQAGVTVGTNATLTGRALTTSLGSVTMAGANTVGGCSSAFAPAPGPTPGPGPVPTLSQWATIGLTLLLALSGVAALRARRI
jgi:ice-binding like protein/exosortase sorting signal-containing protein